MGDGNECGRRGVDGGVWLIGCTGVEGTGGNVDPEGRYLAGSGPDVVDPTGEWQRRSSWSRTGDDAIRFPGRGKAEACYHAAPADAPLGPGGTPNRPLSVHRVAVEYEPPGLPPVAENPGRQSLLGQLDPGGLPTMMPAT